MRRLLQLKPGLQVVTRRASWFAAVIPALCGLAGMICSQNACGQMSTYTIFELQSGATPSRLNNLGDVAGRVADPATGEGRATTWSHGGMRRRVLGKLGGGDYSSASAISDAGQVVGAGNISNSVVPFIWTSGNGFRRIALPAGHNCGQAVAINLLGHVTGYSSGPNGKTGFLWTRGNQVHRLDPLPGGRYSTASDVNDSDDVVGTSGSTAGDRAVIWTSAGETVDLGTLPGDFASEATSINNNGTVTGYSRGPQGTRAFVWTETNGIQQLGVLPGGTSSRALAINDADTVVGSSATGSGDHAFIWTQQSGIRDLNSDASLASGVVLVEAHAINNRGQILALGMNRHEMGNMSDASLCAPAPPSSFVLTPQ